MCKIMYYTIKYKKLSYILDIQKTLTSSNILNFFIVLYEIVKKNKAKHISI